MKLFGNTSSDDIQKLRISQKIRMSPWLIGTAWTVLEHKHEVELFKLSAEL